MANMTTKRATYSEQVVNDLAENKTFPIRALTVLAKADALGLNYSVYFNPEKAAVDVRVEATVNDLGYPEAAETRVWLEPSEMNYTLPWSFTDLETLVVRVQQYKDELARLHAIKAKAMSKLTEEEKLALGLTVAKRN